jgi:hypothetical protein
MLHAITHKDTSTLSPFILFIGLDDEQDISIITVCYISIRTWYHPC